jgi:hypothetical protein
MRALANSLAVFRTSWMERIAHRVIFLLEVSNRILSTVIVVFLEPWPGCSATADRSEVGIRSWTGASALVVTGSFRARTSPDVSPLPRCGRHLRGDAGFGPHLEQSNCQRLDSASACRFPSR